MPKSTNRFRNSFEICFLLALALLTVSTRHVVAQETSERDRAFQLYRDAKYKEALPLFEKLEKTNPDDAELLEKFGFLMINQDALLSDPAERKAARKRARDLFIRAQKAGAESAMLNALIADIPPDGGADRSFSPKKEIDVAMRAGEAAFAKHDFTKAIEKYQEALLLDPKLYTAALFIGDSYYASADQRKAGEWFGRAVAIDPDRETAYRYWGDSLMKLGRVTEAGDKFVEAFIAEPYNKMAAVGLIQWAQRVNIELAHPKVEIPTSVSRQDNGSTTINLDPTTLKKDDKGGSGTAWMMYGLIRASWTDGEFAKQYPDEKKYRHSLKEEAAALRAAIRSVKDPDPMKLDSSLQNLLKLEKDGLLEAFILMALPDEGIARDFPAYRKENIQKLRKYVTDYVMTGGGRN